MDNARFLRSYTKIHFKWVADLNMKIKDKAFKIKHREISAWLTGGQRFLKQNIKCANHMEE